MINTSWFGCSRYPPFPEVDKKWRHVGSCTGSCVDTHCDISDNLQRLLNHVRGCKKELLMEPDDKVIALPLFFLILHIFMYTYNKTKHSCVSELRCTIFCYLCHAHLINIGKYDIQSTCLCINTIIISNSIDLYFVHFKIWIGSVYYVLYCRAFSNIKQVSCRILKLGYLNTINVWFRFL